MDPIISGIQSQGVLNQVSTLALVEPWPVSMPVFAGLHGKAGVLCHCFEPKHPELPKGLNEGTYLKLNHGPLYDLSTIP